MRLSRLLLLRLFFPLLLWLSSLSRLGDDRDELEVDLRRLFFSDALPERSLDRERCERLRSGDLDLTLERDLDRDFEAESCLRCLLGAGLRLLPLCGDRERERRSLW